MGGVLGGKVAVLTIVRYVLQERLGRLWEGLYICRVNRVNRADLIILYPAPCTDPIPYIQLGERRDYDLIHMCVRTQRNVPAWIGLGVHGTATVGG